MSDSISVVVPVFNSASTVATLSSRLLAVLPSLTSRFEILLVNDGSRDQSWLEIQRLCAEHPDVIVGFDLMRNYGQHNATLCGIRAARYDVIVTIDDDLQQPPEQIPVLLEKMNEAPGYDVVYGIAETEQHGWRRNVGSRLMKATLRRGFGAEVAPMISAFRALRSSTRPAFINHHGPFLSIDVLLTWASTRFGVVTVRREPRAEGRSNYRLRTLLRLTFNMLTGFSVLPLHLAALIGFGLTLFGAGVLVYVVGRYFLAGGSVAGFPFLASTIAIFSGAQLFALGIIGEYLGQVHLRTMGQPAYLIRNHTSSRPAHEDDSLMAAEHLAIS